MKQMVVVAAACAASFAAEVRVSVPGKNIATYKVESKALGETRQVNVLAPVDYEKSTRRYPVLYLLHGYGDDHSAWSYMTNLSGYASERQVIVVMPDGGRSFYVNSAADPKAKFEDFIAKDLVAWTDSMFRTIPLRRSRAVAGLSMGGYGAAFHGLKHHRVFSAFASFSGALSISRPKVEARFRKRTGPGADDFLKPFGAEDSADRVERDPFALLEKVPPAELPLIYIACGGQDFLVTSNREFVALLAKNRIPYEYREVSPRGHTWDFWDDQIKVFLEMLASREGWR